MALYSTQTLEIKLNPNDDGTLNSDSRVYIADMIQEIPQSISKDAMSIALPGADYRDNILMGMSGMESDVSLNCFVHKDGTDRADGTFTNTDCAQGDNFTEDSGNYKVVTVQEQLQYLRRVMFDPGFDATWMIDTPDVASGDIKPFDNIEVFVEGMDISWMNTDSPSWRVIRVDLRVGSGIS